MIGEGVLGSCGSAASSVATVGHSDAERGYGSALSDMDLTTGAKRRLSDAAPQEPGIMASSARLLASSRACQRSSRLAARKRRPVPAAAMPSCDRSPSMSAAEATTARHVAGRRAGSGDARAILTQLGKPRRPAST